MFFFSTWITLYLNLEKEEAKDHLTERLSTSSVFITPNPSPDKDEKKKEESDEEKKDKLKDLTCKKVCSPYVMIM